MARPFIVFAALLTLCSNLLLSVGCSSKPFDVKTEVTLPATVGAPVVESQGVRLQAAAVRDEDYLLSTFDANLILAGVLPVKMTMTNSGAQPLDLRKARFEVRTADGHAYKATDAKRVYKRLIDYYGISTYSKGAYNESRDEFAAYALDLSRPLAMGESRQGMLFFILPDRAIQATGLKLIGVRLGSSGSSGTVELQLD
jgi:hypothetical protein